MQFVLNLSLVAVLSGSALLGQQPTWVEQLFKTKTGRTHPAYEARVSELKKADKMERFSKLDKNKDGVISVGEWQESTDFPASLDVDGNGAISLVEWTSATPNAGSL